MDDGKPSARFLDLNRIARRNQIRRNVYDLAIHRDVTVHNKLPCRFARWREVQAIDNIIQPALEELHQIFARNAAKFRGLLEGIAKLRFEHSIQAADLLLLPKLN